MPGPVEVGLLGPVEVRVDGVNVALASAPQRVLLARLALAAGKVVGAASLIDAIWGGNPPENADKNVHVYISRLRTGWEQALAAVLLLLRSGLPEHQWATATLQAAAARTYARLGQTAAALQLLARPVRALTGAPAWAPNYLRTACDVAETLWLLDARDHLTGAENALQQALRTDFHFPMMDARLALARLCALDGCHDEARRWFAAARTGLKVQSARPL